MTTIAYICADPGIPVFGTKGASVHVQEIIRAWRALGARVRLYCTRIGEDMPADLADVEVTCVPVGEGEGEDKLERAADRERRVAEAAAELARRVIADGADGVYERFALFSEAAATVTRSLGIPGILEVNAPLIEEQRDHRLLVDEAGARRSLAVQARAVGRIATVSAPVSEWVSRSLPDVDLRAKLVVAPNGVNTERISQVTFAPEPVVLFVGTLKPWHGVEDLLRAATLAERRWRIRIVGDGPQGPALRQLAGTAELDVEFAGAVAPQDVPAYLDGAWVAVAPYPARSDQYFSPLKVYEYSAAGLPVVASHVGQIPSVVADGVTGVLVPPSDPPALARAIDRLVADPVTARAMGRAGREQMLKTHTWHHALRTILGDELAESLTSEVVIA